MVYLAFARGPACRHSRHWRVGSLIVRLAAAVGPFARTTMGKPVMVGLWGFRHLMMIAPPS
jgi:hypothetical protein